MKVRIAAKPHLTGQSSEFNVHALCEILFGFDPPNEDMDSVPCSEVEVYVEAKQQWMSMRDAFACNDIIVNNYNTRFFEPTNVEDKERGFTLN